MLIDQINADFISAYKAKDEVKTSVLRLLKASLKNEEIAKKSPLQDEDAIKVLKREVKQRKDSATEYRKVGQPETASKEEAEIGIIEAYLPAQLDEAAIRAIVQNKITALGAEGQSAMGKVIGAVMSEHGDEVDGATVSKVVRELLG